MRSAAFILAAGFASVGCQGIIGNPANGNAGLGGQSGPSPSPTASPQPCAVSHNDEIRLKLAPTCAACHSIGSNRPFFTTPESFEDLLAYDPRYVTPGKPDQSYLVSLLEGMGQGAYKQMPINGDPFVTRAANGQTDISMKEVRDWIASLPAVSARGSTQSPGAPTARRLTAEELVLGMRRVLGLPENGVWWAGGVNLVVRAADAEYGPNESGDLHGAVQRFEALGGPVSLSYQPRTKDLTPTLLQTIVQMSQDWCASAISDPNTALLHYASLTSTSAKDADAIRKNLAYLHLRFLGEVASDSDVDDLYQNVFLKYEGEGAGVAWQAACASLIRNVQFLML